MHAEQWGSLIGQIVGPQSVEARSYTCLQIVQGRAGYSPLRFSHPPEWGDDESSMRKHQFVESLRNLGGEIADVREGAQANPLAFGEWRRAVGDHEAANAAKLQVLIWTVQTFHGQIGGEDTASIERLKYLMLEHLSRSWEIQEVPVTGPYRDWCSRMTREYRLLPKAWRYA